MHLTSKRKSPDLEYWIFHLLLIVKYRDGKIKADVHVKFSELSQHVRNITRKNFPGANSIKIHVLGT